MGHLCECANGARYLRVQYPSHHHQALAEAAAAAFSRFLCSLCLFPPLSSLYVLFKTNNNYESANETKFEFVGTKRKSRGAKISDAVDNHLKSKTNYDTTTTTTTTSTQTTTTARAVAAHFCPSS